MALSYIIAPGVYANETGTRSYIAAPGVYVDENGPPPFTNPGRLAIVAGIIGAWVAIDPLPTLPAKLVQPAAAAAAQNPYTRAWMSSVVAAWQPPDQSPTLPRNLNPSITAVPVNNPPFTHRERLFLHASIVDANQPPPPWPFIGGAGPLMPYRSVFGIRVDNPPFTHLGRVVVTAAVASMAQPPDPQPFLGGHQPLEPARLNPSITAVPVNNPPFGSRTHVPNILKSWEEPPPPPWFHNLYVQPTVIYVPSALAWLPGVLRSWVEPERPPDIPRRLSPGIPGQSIDNPPRLRTRTDWPFWDILPQQQAPRPYTRVEVVGQPYLSPSLAATIWAWQAPAPLPTLARKLPPQVAAVPVDNPPFDQRGRVVPSIVQAWQPKPFVFRPPYVPTARFVQPFLGIRIIAKPSLSGLDYATTLKGKVEND